MRALRAIMILGTVAALMGCVPAYVDGPVYGRGYGYVAPRYFAPAPRFYAPPRHFGGGYARGWHGRGG